MADGELCRSMRTKASYVPGLRPDGQPLEPSETAYYWCLRTMTCVGPDDRPVHIERCRTGRVCCETEAEITV